jgi:hypothetical protein
VRDGLDGRLIRNPEDEVELQHALGEMLAAPDDLHRMARAAQRRVHDGFLVLAQLRSWGQLLGAAVESSVTEG